MTRSRSSAKRAGRWMQQVVADYLKLHVNPDIEQRKLSGAKDRGDISGLKHMGQRLTVEVKNVTAWSPGTWIGEAEVERLNDDAGVGIVVCKRSGRTDPGGQIVLMTLADFVSLLTGSRPDLGEIE